MSHQEIMFSALTSIDWQSLYRVKRPPLANQDEKCRHYNTENQ